MLPTPGDMADIHSMTSATDRLPRGVCSRPHLWVGVVLLALIALASCHDVILGPDHHDSAVCSLCQSLSHAVVVESAASAVALLLTVSTVAAVSSGAHTRARRAWHSRAPPTGFISSIC